MKHSNYITPATDTIALVPDTILAGSEPPGYGNQLGSRCYRSRQSCQWQDEDEEYDEEQLNNY